MDTKKLAIVFSILAMTLALPSHVQNVVRAGVSSEKRSDLKINKVEADLCPTCIQFTDQAINELLNIILNTGVVGTCSTLCNALEQKTGSQVLGAVCNILCDIVGVEAFAKLVEEADLDPIYLCELLKTCPVFDSGDATITGIQITPKSGPRGTRNISFGYTSKNGTGTGEIVVVVETVDGIPIEDGFLQEPKKAGDYTQSLSLKAMPDPNCDPTQQPCEMWEPGNYTVRIELCNGECGSKHPHSQVYDVKSSTFEITSN